MTTLPASPNHKDRGHAALGASSCERWWHCPGSIRLSKGIHRGSSAAADRGTAQHELAEMCLAQKRDAIEFLDRKVHTEIIDEEMAEAVQVYVDFIRSRTHGIEESEAEVTVLIEQEIDLAPIKPPEPMFGTTDACVIDWNNRKLTVIDAKFGRKPVSAIGNKQMRYYALGTLLGLVKDSKWPEIDTIEMVIVQPYVTQEFSRETITVAELKAWAKELLVRAKATQDPEAPLVPDPSSHGYCFFCPASAICPERAKQALQVACDEFDDLPEVSTPQALEVIPPPTTRVLSLTPEQLSRVLERAEDFDAWIKAVRQHAYYELVAGRPIPGWKLVNKRAKRVFNQSEDQIKNLLQLDLDLAEEELYERKFRSVAQVEKMVGKKKFEAFDGLHKVVAKIVPGVTMASESDKRPAVSAPPSSAALEFDNLEEDE